MKKKTRRFIEIKDEDGNILNTLELSRVTSVRTQKEMIHLDKLNDDTWRLIYNEETINDISNVFSLDIKREN